MKLCLSGRLWESAQGSSITLPEFLATAAELGYTGIELRYPMIPPPERMETTRAEAKRLGLTIVFSTCVALPKSDATRADAQRVLNAIKTLGAHDIRATVLSEADFPSMRTLADMAAEKGIKTTIQMHINTLSDTVERTEQCLEKLGHPNVFLIFDPMHLRWMGDPDMAGAARRLSKWIVRANVQNYAPIRETTKKRGAFSFGGTDWVRALPGEEGGTDYPAYFKALRGAGFDGWINVMCDVEPGLDSKRVAQKHADFLKPMIS